MQACTTQPARCSGRLRAARRRSVPLSRRVAAAACASPPPAGDTTPQRHTYRLRLAYDGAAYAGFQLQPLARGDSVQRRLELALSRVLSEPRDALSLASAGRTDAGVHASGQVCSFTAARAAPRGAHELGRSLNGVLPDDIRVLSCAAAPHGFSARFAARGKAYHYAIDNAPVANPLTRRYAAHVFAPLDVGAMRAAAAHFVGTHNFAPFANVATVEVRARVERRGRTGGRAAARGADACMPCACVCACVRRRSVP
jgi:tRNA pseudouridine(38-40) synthase